MKPEHAQEIYEIISNLDDLANSHCIGDRDKIDEDVERARELLGLERPDVPEPGTIIEFVEKRDWEHCSKYPNYQRGRVDAANGGWDRYVCTKEDDNGSGSYDIAYKWRYPGEKEWRE